MGLINMVENFTTRAGASRKLECERKQKIVTVLLVEVPEIKIKVGHDSGSSFACDHNVLDDGGTGENLSPDRKEARNNIPDYAFPRARYINRSLSKGARPKAEGGWKRTLSVNP